MLTDEGILQLTQVSYSKGMSTVSTGVLISTQGSPLISYLAP